MSDYIKREDAIKNIENLKKMPFEINVFEGAVYDVPAADVEPVRHGHWDSMFNGKFTGGAYWYRCSDCGRIVPDVRNGGWNYCPDCGAKMDGEE